jgi:hypothetical protein
MVKQISKNKILNTVIITLIGLTHLHGATQEVELKGEIKCGPPQNGGQGYSQPLSIRISEGYGIGLTETAETIENQELTITADGSVRYNAIGIWKNQPNRRWRIHGIGTLDGLSIKASGHNCGQ